VNEVRGLLELLNAGGVLAALLMFVIGIFRRWIIPGWLYEQEVKRGDYWQALAMRAAPVGRDAVAVAEKLL